MSANKQQGQQGQERRAELSRIIDKIRKLLALGNSPNEHEAAAAVAKAKSMLEAYDLTIESVADLKADARTSIQGSRQQEQVGTEGKPDGWKGDLFETVAITSDCYTAYSYQNEYIAKGARTRQVRAGKIIGFGHDVEMAGYAYSFLVKEVERLAQDYADKMWREIREMERDRAISHQEAESQYTYETGRHPLKAKLYWTRGAVETVCEGLRVAQIEREREREAQAEENGGGAGVALVLDKRSALRDHQYLERYGRTYAEQEAYWAAMRTQWANETPTSPVPERTAKKETEAQIKRREEQEAKRQRRADEAYWAKVEQQEAKKDKKAYRDGLYDGEAIKIKPGIGRGKEEEREQQAARLKEGQGQ